MANFSILKRTTARTKTRVGRGGKRGKTSGKGTKGQNSRAGRKKRPEWRDIIKKLPKRRGYGKNRARTVNPLRSRPEEVTLAKIAAAFDAGAEVSPKALLEKGVVALKNGHAPKVKILGNALDKKFSFTGVQVSAGAKAAIEKAGGKVA